MNEDNKRNKILLVILSALLGGFFVFSAWTKTQPVQYFEYTMESQLRMPHMLASVAARFFIGLEAALGVLLVTNIFGYGRWVLKGGIALLLFFSVELLYLLMSHGNDVNCGCMGDIVPMSPAVSLLKNLGLLAGLFILLKWHKTQDGPLLDYGSIGFTALIAAIPFILFPMSAQLKMPLSKLYTTTLSEHPKVELRKGKHILCLMSLSCPHCRHAASRIMELQQANSSLPFYFALSSGADSTREERFRDFVSETGFRDIPYHFLAPPDFMYMVEQSASNGIPVILWMQDTTVIRKVKNVDEEMNLKDIEAWLAQ